MDFRLPNGVTGSFPAPTNHIADDPTPLDQAVYIPSVTPGYAVAAYNKDWKRDLPAGVAPGDLDFLDPNNKLFRISHVMSSAGQALFDKRPCIIKRRDRSATMMIGDSGGYQIANGVKIDGDRDRLKILRWLEQHADWAMTLDVPTGPLDKPGYAYRSFRHCLDTTLSHLDFFQANRVPGATKFLNVLQGNTTQQTDTWFDAVKGYEFEGWAFAGKLRHNFFNLCRRIIKMAEQNLIQDRDWIHVLGTNELQTAVGLTALQRAINRHINPRLRISFDTSTPFRMNSWHGTFSMPAFDKKGMTLKAVSCPDARHLRHSQILFPWSSPMGDRMTLGDLCVKDGVNLNSYHDPISHHLLAHHNLASLCNAVSSANRVFDAEGAIKQRQTAILMGRVVDIIDHSISQMIDNVIRIGTVTELERYRGDFKRVRTEEKIGEYEEDREFRENYWE